MRPTVVILLTVLLAFPAVLEAQEPLTLGEGARVYAATCARCHNPRGPGERSDLEWDVITLHMRTRGNLTGRETRAVLFFLQATNGVEGERAGPAARAPDTEVVEEGGALVERKGCMACHRVGDYTWGTLGPDLNTLFRRRTGEYVLQKISDPKTDNPESLMPHMNLTPRQREAIIAYLRTVQK